MLTSFEDSLSLTVWPFSVWFTLNFVAFIVWRRSVRRRYQQGSWK